MSVPLTAGGWHSNYAFRRDVKYSRRQFEWACKLSLFSFQVAVDFFLSVARELVAVNFLFLSAEERMESNLGYVDLDENEEDEEACVDMCTSLSLRMF